MRLTVSIDSLKPGDRVIERDHTKEQSFIVDRPDVPTRVVSKAFEIDNWNVGVEVPKEWLGQECTALLGRDELPKDVKQSVDCTEPGNGTYDHDGPATIMGDFIRSRYPEAFEVKP